MLARFAPCCSLAPRCWHTACGTHHTRSGGQLQPDGGLQSTDSALAELDALPCPEGVDSALWAELKGALEEALCCRARTCIAPLEDSGGTGDGGVQVPALHRNTSTPPTGDQNRVDDLGIADNGDGTYTLTWHYRNLGDYDQNGKVAIADITPLAQHFGQTYDPETEPNSIQAVIDGSGNGKVGIEDITPIAQHFQTDVDCYVIEGAEAQSGPWGAVGEVAQDAGTGEGRLEYAETIQSPAALWHRVVPYDAEGNPGEPSNAVLRPSNEPIIYEVTPTSGYQHEEYTFAATVSGAEPLAYAWDFGGGAAPNTSSEVSPIVTLADGGEYNATLTASNSYGSTDFPFTLTVSERDMWTHTWGGTEDDTALDMELDDQGDMYLLGRSVGFGAGDLDILLLKFSQAGEVVWSQAWASEYEDSPTAVLWLSSGRLLVCGGVLNVADKKDEVLLLEVSPEGEVLRAMGWGTPDDHEYAYALTVDEDGNIYLAGLRTIIWGDTSVLLMKLDADWNVLWAEVWGSTAEDERAYGLLLTDGALLVSGTKGDDALLMKVSLDGEVLWAKTWGTEGLDSFGDMISGPEGYTYALGTCLERNSLLLKCSASGNVLGATGWNLDEKYTLRGLCLDPWGALTVAGGQGRDLVVVTFDRDLNLLQGMGRSPASGWDSGTGVAYDADGNLYLAGWTESLECSWGPIEDRSFVPDGTEGMAEGNVVDLSGTSWVPEGTMTDIAGVIDTATGSDDFLILKNYPK